MLKYVWYVWYYGESSVLYIILIDDSPSYRIYLDITLKHNAEILQLIS
jgi:hypothetical protein